MRRLIPTLLTAIVLSACASSGGDRPTSDDGPPSSDPGSGAPPDAVLVIEEGAVADGPGISVTEALAFVGGQPVLVNGSLFIDADGDVLLCEAIAESFPPQCGGARLAVEGLDPGGQQLDEANGVRWAESVQLFGRVVAER
ncbi:MAG: hypothetical protein LC744_07090 [Chloroflexi bacterium]|nr:hypothetical protein [Chloroflexota bacterium]